MTDGRVGRVSAEPLTERQTPREHRTRRIGNRGVSDACTSKSNIQQHSAYQECVHLSLISAWREIPVAAEA
eukprot:503139-Rhodomonas_salina.1